MSESKSSAIYDSQTLEEIWEQYHRTGSIELRDELIKNYLHLVRYVASKMALSVPPSVQVDDLVSAGVVGLIDAIGKYDPNRDTKFETYAVSRIRGAIVDDLRSLDWVPRSVRRKARMIEDAYGELETELGRSATDEEISHRLNMSVEEFRSAVDEIVSAGLLSLDDFVGTDDGDRTTRVIDLVCSRGNSPSAPIEYDQMRHMLAKAIMNLPEKERTVIALYYYEDMTLKEIGRTLGVSESRVSQIHTKAILRLRGRLRAQRESLLSVTVESAPESVASLVDEKVARELVTSR